MNDSLKQPLLDLNSFSKNNQLGQQALSNYKFEKPAMLLSVTLKDAVQQHSISHSIPSETRYTLVLLLKILASEAFASVSDWNSISL